MPGRDSNPHALEGDTCLAGNNGGGIYVYQGTTNLQIQEVKVTSNSINSNAATNGNGGGIYNDHGNVTIKGTHLNANTSKLHGGGIYNDHGTVTFSLLDKGKSMVVANKTGGTKGNGGGGIYSDGGTLDLNSIKMQSNKPDQCVKVGGTIVLNGNCTA
jgi:fibronectin-binding autotransporter adhesin